MAAIPRSFANACSLVSGKNLQSLTLLSALICASTTYGQGTLPSAPERGAVTIESLTYEGDACPEGSTSAGIAPDNTALTLFFADYNVTAEAPASPRTSKTCLIKLQLNVPKGWRYSIFAMDYRGYANLDAGVTSEQKTAYSLSAHSGALNFADLGTLKLAGPISQEFLHSAAIPLTGLSWSQCSQGGSQPLAIATTATISAIPPPAQAVVQLSSSRGRRAELDLGKPILAVELLRKDSAAPCRLGSSFGSEGTKIWVNHGCRGEFRVTHPAAPLAGNLTGLMTIDSLDAEIKSNYGIIWQYCDLGVWTQSDGTKPCEQVCRQAGKTLTNDPSGAQCVSGEARPASAVGLIEFKKGCWGSCDPQGSIATQAVGPFCYAPGQRRDADATDRAVGCFCK